MTNGIRIRELRTADIPKAEQIRKLAFGTLFNLPDPARFRGDAALLPARCWAFPDGGFIAEADGEMVGVAVANNWGSLGLFGPLAVHPGHWKKGIARQLMKATMPVFDTWRSRLVGLFTFPERTSHVRLYEEFGFWPRFLMPIMTKPAVAGTPVANAVALSTAREREALIAGCGKLTDAIWAGLDLTREIAMVLEFGLGEILVLAEGSQIRGFAICHAGKGSEGGSASCYVKFAAVPRGIEAARHFGRLLDACENFAASRGIGQVAAGINMGRHAAYRAMLARGFRATLQGVALHRPWEPAYDRDDVFVIDDWR